MSDQVQNSDELDSEEQELTSKKRNKNPLKNSLGYDLVKVINFITANKDKLEVGKSEPYGNGLKYGQFVDTDNTTYGVGKMTINNKFEYSITIIELHSNTNTNVLSKHITTLYDNKDKVIETFYKTLVDK